jgi:hypothetical protein
MEPDLLDHAFMRHALFSDAFAGVCCALFLVCAALSPKRRRKSSA